MIKLFLIIGLLFFSSLYNRPAIAINEIQLQIDAISPIADENSWLISKAKLSLVNPFTDKASLNLLLPLINKNSHSFILELV